MAHQCQGSKFIWQFIFRRNIYIKSIAGPNGMQENQIKAKIFCRLYLTSSLLMINLLKTPG